MNKWRWITVVTEVLGTACAVLGLIAEVKTMEDTDEHIRQIVREETTGYHS